MVLGAEGVSRRSFVFFNDTLPSLALIIPIGLFLILLLLSGIFGLILYCCPKYTTNTRVHRALEQLRGCFRRMEQFMHYTVRTVFRMKPSQGDTDESPKTELFGYVVPVCFLGQIFCMVGFLSGYALFTFISIFFVKESDDCVADDPDLGCFTTNASNITVSVNCSTIDSTFNGTMPDLQCYEFVFQTLEALSAAGGIISMGSISFTVIIALILSISKGKDGCEGLCGVRCILHHMRTIYYVCSHTCFIGFNPFYWHCWWWSRKY